MHARLRLNKTGLGNEFDNNLEIVILKLSTTITMTYEMLNEYIWFSPPIPRTLNRLLDGVLALLIVLTCWGAVQLPHPHSSPPPAPPSRCSAGNLPESYSHG